MQEPMERSSAARANLLYRDGEVRHYPSFFPERQSDALLKELVSQLPWAQEVALMFGRRVALPRLTAWFGPVEYAYSGVLHPARELVPVLERIRNAIEPVSGPEDSVLANLYRDGRDSVSWHADDEALWGDRPTIASVSFGASRRFLLRHRMGGEKVEVVLGHGSVLLMAGVTQHHWVHCVPKTTTTLGPRVNLTFRRVAGAVDRSQPRS